MKCLNCGHDNSPEMRYCGMCGTRLGQECPVCGFSNPPEHRFCGMCGARLGELPPSRLSQQQALAQSGTSAEAADVLSEVHPAPLASEIELPVGSRGIAARFLEGERRPATVVVADVSRSTDLLEQLGTEDWVEVMNDVLQILETEVYRWGGEVHQFRGDGLVAFFGATTAHEDDPERAVLAGLGMQSALNPFAARLRRQRGIDLRVRVGVNTGEVVVTSIGDQTQHREDTAMGEAVALAARMESAAEPGTVLVSENTFRLAQSCCEWQAMGEIMVKGVSRPIAVYRPLAARTDLDRLEGHNLHGRSMPLIGREAEFQLIKSRVAALFDGRGGILHITGDEGIGKTFLVAKAREQLEKTVTLPGQVNSAGLAPGTLTWLSGRCRSYDQTWPYSMWSSLFRNWLGMRRGEPTEEIRDRLRHEAELLWGDCMAEHYPYLATFLSLPLEEQFIERIKHLDAEGLREQFSLAIKSWTEAMAHRNPLVLSFGDVHWADATSLDLLKYCLPVCEHKPVLWLVVFRPDRASPAWDFHHFVETEYPHRLTSLRLPPLTGNESREFLNQLVGAGVLPEETRKLVLDKAQGNPFYIAELVHTLIDQGVLIQDAKTGDWQMVRAVTSLDLPDSLQTLLLAYIDRLPLQARRVLQLAAVIGSVFWEKVVETLAGGVPRVREPLRILQREHLIEERGRMPDLGMEYIFQSSLVRDAAYAGLLTGQRAAYHEQVAAYLEATLSDNALPDYYGLVAYHYHQAGVRRRELLYTLLAAEQAQRVYANAEALKHYTRALDLLHKIEGEVLDAEQARAVHTQQFEVVDGRRRVYSLLGDWEAADTDAHTLLQLAQCLPEEPVWMIDALLAQPGVTRWHVREELDAGVPLAEKAFTLAREAGDQQREMESVLAVSRQRIFLDDPSWQEMGERALHLARELGDRHSEARILIWLGTRLSWTNQPEQGMAYLLAALPISKALDDKVTEVELLNQLGLESEREGDYYRLLSEYQQKRLQLSREIGYRRGEGTSLTLCGQTQGLYLGDYEGALDLLEQARDIVSGTTDEIFALLRIVQIHALLGDLKRALSVLEHMQRLDEYAVLPHARAGLRLVTTTLYRMIGDETHLRQGVDLLEELHGMIADNPLLPRQYEIAIACEAAAIHLALVGCMADGSAEHQAHLEQALEAAQRALDTYEHFGYVQIIECVSEEIFYRYSQALHANGQTEDARTALQQAHGEMMRKHLLIPPDSLFHHTFLASIPLHRELQAAYAELQ